MRSAEASSDEQARQSVAAGSVARNDETESQAGPEAGSSFRRLASQCCGVFATDCLRFTTSTFVGFHITLIAELHKENAELSVTLDQLTWIASLNFLVPIGSIANGFVTQRMGSRFVMLSSTAFFVTSWLLYHYAWNASMVIAGRVIYSLTSGALKTPTSTYVTEISQPHLRGSFLATNHLAAAFGMFFSLLLGSFMYWRTIALVNIVFPIFSFIIVLLIPDSPVWLASKGRFDDAELALSWLRGWVKPSDVKSEYRTLVENCQRSSSSSTVDLSCSTPGPINSEGKSSGKLRRLFAAYLERSFYLPLATVSLIYFVHFFSGISAIQTYSIIIFQKMSSPIEESLATALMGGMRVIGALIILFSIHLTGKRKLMFASLIVAGSCYLVIASVGFLTKGQLRGVDLWVSPIAMIIAVFANSSGAETIVHMLNSEIFPVDVRYIGSAIGTSVSSIMQSLLSKAFLYMLDGLTLPGVFLYFAFMNCVGLVVYHFVFPETEGRSLKEIEDHYRGVRSLNDCVSKDDDAPKQYGSAPNKS